MAIQGLRDQADIIARFNDRPESWREGILMLEPNGDAPLFALTAALSSGTAETDSVIHWFEEDLPRYQYTLSDAAASNATDLDLTSGAQDLKIGDILEVDSTEEHLLVTANPSTATSITVQRAFGGGGADGETSADSAYGHKNAAVAAEGSKLTLIGSIYGEGGRMPASRTFNAYARETFCQIQKDTIGITGSAHTTRVRTGDQWTNDRRRCAQRHAINLERSFFRSRKWKGTINDAIAYRMSGVLEQIPDERSFTVPEGGMDLETFEEKSQEIFLWGSNEKMAFCGHSVLTAVQQLVRRNNTVELQNMEQEYGMLVRRLHTPHGTLVLKSHPQFNYIPNWNGLCVIMDMANIQYCHKTGRDTQWLENLEENDRDGAVAGFMTDCALKVMHRKTHYLIKDWTAGKRDA